MTVQETKVSPQEVVSPVPRYWRSMRISHCQHFHRHLAAFPEQADRQTYRIVLVIFLSPPSVAPSWPTHLLDSQVDAMQETLGPVEGGGDRK